MSCRAVTLKKGMVVARLSPANVVPKMLTPKLTNDQLGQESANYEGNTDPELVRVSNKQKGGLLTKNQLGSTPVNKEENMSPELTERVSKLFAKLDLSGCDGWTESQRQSVYDCIREFHHIFAIEDLELGKTDMVKHVIHLDNYVPLRSAIVEFCHINRMRLRSICRKC